MAIVEGTSEEYKGIHIEKDVKEVLKDAMKV